MKLLSLLLALLLLHTTYTKIVSVPIVRREIKREANPAESFLEKGALPRAPILDIGDSRYNGVFYVGSNKTPIELHLDTGSCPFWVRAKGTADGFDGVDTFDCDASTTCKKYPDISKSTNYADGSGFTGYMITDSVTYGDVTIKDFAIVYAQQKAASNASSDGVIGLSITKPSAGFKLFPVAVRDSGAVSSSSFAMYLGLGGYSAKEAVIGELTFGGYNPALAAGEFRYVPIPGANPNGWTTTFQGISFGTNQIVTSSAKNQGAILDSGTSDLIVPTDIYNILLAQIAAAPGNVCTYSASAGTIQCDCTRINSLPSLFIYIGGLSAPFEVPPSAIFPKPTGKSCGLSLDPSSTLPVMLGDVFLRNFYTFYNYDNATVGLAKPVPNLPTAIKAGMPNGAVLAVLSMLVLFCLNKKQKTIEQKNTNESQQGESHFEAAQEATVECA